MRFVSIVIYVFFFQFVFAQEHDTALVPIQNLEKGHIQDGVLNILKNDFTQKQTLNLKGDILFYWKQWPLDTNNNFNPGLLMVPDTISLPSALWTTKGHDAKGYGTFRFFLKKEDVTQPLVYEITRAFVACEIWINGKQSGRHGIISKNALDEEIDGRPLRIELPNDSDLDVIIVVSNHKHRLGGGLALRNTIIEKEHFTSALKRKELLEGVLTFLILLFGCYQIATYVSLPKYNYFLYLGLFCLLGASRQLFVGEALIYHFFSEISFNTIQKMRYITYYGCLGAVFMYHNALFPGYFSRKIIQTFIGFVIIGILYVICAPVFYSTYSAPVFQVFGVIMIVLGFYHIMSAVKDKKPYAL